MWRSKYKVLFKSIHIDSRLYRQTNDSENGWFFFSICNRNSLHSLDTLHRIECIIFFCLLSYSLYRHKINTRSKKEKKTIENIVFPSNESLIHSTHTRFPCVFEKWLNFYKLSFISNAPIKTCIENLSSQVFFVSSTIVCFCLNCIYYSLNSESLRIFFFASSLCISFNFFLYFVCAFQLRLWSRKLKKIETKLALFLFCWKFNSIKLFLIQFVQF